MMKLVTRINIVTALAIVWSAPSYAETYRYGNTPYSYTYPLPYPYDKYAPGYRYHPGVRGNDYTVETTTTDSRGNPVTIRTEVERDRNRYNSKTSVTGADGQELGSREIDIDFDRNKTQRKVTTTRADGTVDIQTETYRTDD